MNELQEIASKLEKNEVHIDDLVYLFERGNKLSEICFKKINNAKIKINKIIKTNTPRNKK